MVFLSICKRIDCEREGDKGIYRRKGKNIEKRIKKDSKRERGRETERDNVGEERERE